MATAAATTSVDLCWRDGENGGYMSPANPQALLKVSAAGEVKLKLQRAEKIVTGLIIVIVRGVARLTSTPKDPNIVTKSKYLSTASLTITATLPPGDYVVLCCEGKPVAGNKNFTLSATGADATLSELSFAGARLSHTLRMEGEGCAGYGNAKNPQFFFTVKKATSLIVTLRVVSDDDDVKDGVAFFVHKTDSASRFDNWGSEKTRTFTSKYVAGGVVTGTMDAVEPGVYGVLVMKSRQTPSACRLEMEATNDADAQLNGDVYSKPAAESRQFKDELEPHGRAVDVAKLKPTMYDADKARRLVAEINSKLGPTEVFQDHTFGYNEASLNPLADETKRLDPVEWWRPSQLVAKPALFTDGASADDIAQGALGNCWFCASVAAVGGVRPDIASRMFYPSTYNPKGIYAVTVHMPNGDRMAVIIDDSLPTRNGNIAFAHSSDRTEFWFALVEKAFAKIVGGYQALMGRAAQLGTSLVIPMLTGGQFKALKLEAANTDEHWPEATAYCEKRWLVTTSTREVEREKTGLVTTHAYTVLGTAEVDNFRLIHVRNTWGRQEWNGDWSDESPLWRRHPHVADACGVKPDEPANDGAFWMAWKDFVENFETLNLCKFLDDEFTHAAVHEGELAATDARNFHRPEACHQVYVEAAEAGSSLSIRLSSTESSAQRFVAYRAPDDGNTMVRTEVGEEVFASRYKNCPMAEFQLPADCRRLLVLVAAESPGAFRLSLHGTSALTVRQATARKTVETAIKWPPGVRYKAKGSPSVTFKTAAETTVSVLLSLPAEAEKEGLQLALAEGDVEAARPAGKGWPGAPLQETKFVLAREVRLATSNPLPAGTFTIFCTKKNATGGEATVAVMAGAEVSLVET